MTPDLNWKLADIKRLGKDLSLLLGLLLSAACVAGEEHDLAINNGRVIDPETGLDAIRHVGVRNGVIAIVSEVPLDGDTVVDATGLVVAPGFIDRNTYTLSEELFRARAADGVTTTFNFEEGAMDVSAAYEAVENEATINFGFSSSWASARIAAQLGKPIDVEDGIGLYFRGNDAAHLADLSNTPLDDNEMASMLRTVESGLRDGAPAIGIGVDYMRGATNKEVVAIFNLAAKYERSVQIHMRNWDETRDHGEMFEVIAGAVVSGAQIHVSHLNSSSAEYIDIYLAFIEKANEAGIPVTTECYPYTAGMNDIRSTMYDDWREWPDDRFKAYQWPLTGERLTRQTFETYREAGGLVIIHWMQTEWVDACIEHPLTQIASDGGWDDGKTHPRVAGSNSRVLGRYVREKGSLSLIDAIRKMALLPAQSLQSVAPQMAKKGRLQQGMDADIVIFDPDTVIDRATYSEPTLTPVGIEAVVVNGVVVLRHGDFEEGAYPGRAIRLDAIR